MSGLTGRKNFGHSLFIGAGAYTAGFLNVNFGVNPWWSLLAAPLSRMRCSGGGQSRYATTRH
jgi:branched-chain amino acid transport system permease protein